MSRLATRGDGRRHAPRPSSRWSARRGWLPALLVVAATAAPGCASEQKKTNELLGRLPPEGQVAIYDSENDLIIARNRRDTANLGVEAVEREMGELKQRWQRTQDRLKRAGHGDWVGQVRRVYDAHTRYLRAKLAVARVGVDVADSAIGLARAKLEQARFGELVRFGMAPGARLAPLEDRVAAADKHARGIEKREIAVRAKEQKAFEAWKTAEDEYARATGDHDTGIWID